MNKKSVLFVDFACPKPYDPFVLKHSGLGGTEATVVRVAEALSTWYNVFVLQHNRDEISEFGATYFGLGQSLNIQPDFIVALRDSVTLGALREQYPRSRIYLWLHDLVSPIQATLHPLITEAKALPVFVSKWHKESSKEVLKGAGWNGEFRTDYIYNPVDDSIVPDDTEVDNYKLLFTSSPHKGLEYTIKVFKNLYNINNKFKLFIANPGYIETHKVDHPGIHTLGVLPHHKVIKELRSSLCLFHLNHVFPETQGIVYTESQAVGTPFITHQIGAITENSDHPAQIVDTRDPKEVIDRVIKWSEGERPIVRCKPDFRMSEVIKKWTKLLEKNYVK